MSVKSPPSRRLWTLLWPLLCSLLLARGSTAPPEDRTGSTAPPEDRTGSTAPPEDRTDSTAPPEDRTGSTAPPEDRTGSTPPLEDRTGFTPPLEDRTGSTPPLEDQTGSTAPLQPDLQTEAQTAADLQTATPGATNNYTGLSCSPVLPPRRGSFYVEHSGGGGGGGGASVGSALVFWCRDGFQLVGADRIQCGVRNGKPEWSNYPPVCEAIPRPEDRGLRVAVLASVVSGIVILAMSLSFLICCLQERSGGARREGRGRRREKRPARRSECWLEREEGEWEAFPPPKIFHLSQRMNPRLAPDSPLYLTGALGGFENRGYQRSQESLLKASLPGLYRSESQLYPQVVLQRAPAPAAPAAPSAPAAPLYLHLPSAASSPAHSQPHLMAPYATPTYPPIPYPHPAPIYPNPAPAPARPWQ